jgi:hypothetical protein
VTSAIRLPMRFLGSHTNRRREHDYESGGLGSDWRWKPSFSAVGSTRAVFMETHGEQGAQMVPLYAARNRGSKAGRFREGRLRRVRTYSAARASILVTARAQPKGQGSRPTGPGAVPRGWCAGAGCRVDQMGEVGAVNPG